LWVVAVLVAGAGCVTPVRSEKNEQLPGVPQGYGPVRRHVVAVDPSNGQRVYLETKYSLAAVDTIENSTNVKAVTRMTDYKGAYEADAPRVSPDGRYVAYQLLEEENKHINLWTMESLTGLSTIRNTDGPYLNFYPAFSAHGEKILFASNRTDPNSHLWEIKALGGGGGIRRLTDSLEADMWVHEDPTGKDIFAFTRFGINSTRGTIWTYNRQTYLSTQLREGMQPQISPDGSKIVYVRFDEKEAHYNIWVMNIDGTLPTQLTHNDADNITPSWHPSGKWIIFASNKGAFTAKDRATGKESKVHNFDIWMMKDNGEHVSQLTENGSDDDNPVFSPDGKHFYFSSNRGHAVENLSPEEKGKYQARGDVMNLSGIEVYVGTGRDLWRAEVADDVLRKDIAVPARP
jgi:Tol biopolymer transport system component